MFNGVNSITELDVSSWDTSNVTNMSSMFNGVNSITELDVSGFDTSNVTTMTNMFSGARNIEKIYLGSESIFNHVEIIPTLPNINQTDLYTGVWMYYLDQYGNNPVEYITESSSTLLRDYDGSKPGLYKWQQYSTININYIDKYSNNLLDTVKDIGKVGETYKINSRDILGWKLINVVGETEGFYSDGEIDVYYVYELEESSILDPLDPTKEIFPLITPNVSDEIESLRIDFVPDLSFGVKSISVLDQKYFASSLLVKESGSEELSERPNFVQVSNFRTDGSSWTLSVRQSNQFTNYKGEELLGAALSFDNIDIISVNNSEISNENKNITLFPGNTSNIVEFGINEGIGTWIIRFGNSEIFEKSISLDVPGNSNPSSVEYTSKIEWILSEVPSNN